MSYERGSDLTSALKYLYSNKYNISSEKLSECHNAFDVIYLSEAEQTDGVFGETRNGNLTELFNTVGDYWAEHKLTLTFESKSFVYDGSSHTLSAASANPSTGTSVKYSVNGGETWVSNLNSATATAVADSKTVLAKATNSAFPYDVIVEATLEITPRPVTFTGKSEEKTYTGSEITISTVEVNEGEGVGLVSGQTHNVTFSASGTEVGEYEGTITGVDDVVISSGVTDVTANYDVTVVNGTLEIVAAS